MSRAEYLEAHWVNESAGFYALCGKMSAEEENSRLLEIVQAFDVPEAGQGTSSSDIASSSTTVSEACGCGLADDPTLTVVPAELVRPLWGLAGTGYSIVPGAVESGTPLLQEAAIAAASARWLSGEELDEHLQQQAEQLVRQLLERGFAVVQLGAATAAEHSTLMASAGKRPAQRVFSSDCSIVSAYMGQLSDLPRATVLDLITHPLELQQRASSRRIPWTARPLAPTAASSMPDMCIARPSRRSCSRYEQVGRLAVVFGAAVERRSKARPCEASLPWVGWLRKSSVWHAVSTPFVASLP